MKKINFIATLSPQEQRSLTRWYHISRALLILVCMSIGITQCVQLYQHMRVKREAARLMPTQKALQTTQAQKDSLIKNKTELEHNLSTLKTHAAHATATTALAACNGALSTTTSLRSLRIGNGSLTCVLACIHSRDALNFVRTLSKHALFTSVKLTNLQTHQATIVATFA